MKVQILIENRTNHHDCLAEHGLSVYIETAGRKILFDVGASELYRINAEKLGIDLTKVDTVVVSHGHYDHTGGVPSFCDINEDARILIHKSAFEKTYGLENGRLEEETCGIRWTEAQTDKISQRLALTDGPNWITEDIVVSGAIPKLDDFQPTETFYIKSEDGSLLPDPMEHEQFLAVRQRDDGGRSKGIFLFSGCSHNGVISCLQYCKTLFPGERILDLLAGMHLYHSLKEERGEVLKKVAAEEMDYILPVHCTGIDAICELKLLMGERCIPAGAGDLFCF